MEQDIVKQRINDWYIEYSNEIYQYVFFMTSDHAQAKDIIQETFFRAYQKYDQFHGEQPKNWLYKVARNVTIDYLRKNKPIPYFIETFFSVENKGKTPEQIALFHECERELYMALGKLKRSYRDVIILRKIEEFSIKETAQILGWSENKVKVQLFRGLKKLKHELEKEGFTYEII